MEQGDNIEPVLYDALARRLSYYGEIDIWNVAETDWFRLPQESSNRNLCMKATKGRSVISQHMCLSKALMRSSGSTA